MLNRNLVVKSHKSIYPIWSVVNMVTVIEVSGFMQKNALHLVGLCNLIIIIIILAISAIVMIFM
jgi:hypothetical protein